MPDEVKGPSEVGSKTGLVNSMTENQFRLVDTSIQERRPNYSDHDLVFSVSTL